MESPAVTRTGALDTQVCVPEEWTDEQAKAFADEKNPSGTEHGWFVRKDGDAALAGDPERVTCTIKRGYVHLMLDA